MAKLYQGLLGRSRNKIGEIVTYVSKGQQIARAKAASVGNPRTSAQMTQRIRLSNVVAMYKANRVWMDRYAFENKPNKWSVYNAFTSANLATSGVALTKSQAAAGGCVVAPYRMTDGSLSPVNISYNSSVNKYLSDLYLGESGIGADTTVAQLTTKLIANNNGIVEGMQLSLIENLQTFVNNVPRVIVRAYEMILSTSDTSLVSSHISASAFTAELDSTSNKHCIAYNAAADSNVAGFVFVLSQTASGKTRVSPSTMTLTDTDTYNSMCSPSQVAAAIASYGSGNETPFLDSTQQGSSANGDVAISYSVISVARGAAAGVAPDGYLGVASQAVYTITLNQAVDSTADVSAEFVVNDTAVPFASLAINGATLQGSLVSANEGVITGLTVYIDDQEVTCDFAADDSGITE